MALMVLARARLPPPRRPAATARVRASPAVRSICAGVARSPRPARQVAIGIRLGKIGLSHHLDDHDPAREQLHRTGAEGLQQGVQFVVGRRAQLNERGHAIGIAPVHPIQSRAVKVRDSSLPLSHSAESARQRRIRPRAGMQTGQWGGWPGGTHRAGISRLASQAW
jgi:hypothetical protein